MKTDSEVGQKEKGNAIKKQVSHLHMARGCLLSVRNSTSVQNKPIKKRRLKKCNQKCLGCRDSKPAFIFIFSAQTEAFFHLTGDKEGTILQMREGTHALWRSQFFSPMCENMMFVESCYKCLP